MKSLPLTRARHARNFAIALEGKGEPTERLLERTKLPIDLLDSIGGDGIISAANMLDFAEVSAHHTGILDLGFWAGMVPIKQYGEFGKHVVAAPCLHSAILTFCQEVRSECSEADYFVRLGKSSAWFCHGPVATASAQQSQHELYTLMIIIQVIQLAMGATWKPKHIRLQSKDEAGARNNDFFSDINMEFGASITTVEFPLRSLGLPLSSAYTNTSSKTKQYNTAVFKDQFPSDPVNALKKLIETYTTQAKHPNIEFAAELAGVSKRTLQRFLREKDTTYSKLLSQVKFDLALSLLRDPSYSISDISFQLSYANVAHFSRAFKRISSMSPKSYRKIIAQRD